MRSAEDSSRTSQSALLYLVASTKEDTPRSLFSLRSACRSIFAVCCSVSVEKFLAFLSQPSSVYDAPHELQESMDGCVLCFSFGICIGFCRSGFVSAAARLSVSYPLAIAILSRTGASEGWSSSIIPRCSESTLLPRVGPKSGTADSLVGNKRHPDSSFSNFFRRFRRNPFRHCLRRARRISPDRIRQCKIKRAVRTYTVSADHESPTAKPSEVVPMKRGPRSMLEEFPLIANVE